MSMDILRATKLKCGPINSTEPAETDVPVKLSCSLVQNYIYWCPCWYVQDDIL